MAEISLEGRVAVVTGAGRGVGRAVALALAERGASVVINDYGTTLEGEGSDNGPAQAVVDEIVAGGGQAVPSFASVADWDGALEIARTAKEAFGPVDVLVNNAGIVRDRMLFNMSQQDWDDVVHTHLFGAFYCTRAVAPSMRERGSGAIINITSTAGLIGNYGQANYAAAKLGIVALTRITALDLQKYGVTANCVAPWAWTRMLTNVPDEVQAKRGEKSRQLVAEQVAPLIVYLASEEGATTSGQVFSVRGREIVLFSLPRPVRTLVSQQQWTPEALLEMMPALYSGYTDLGVTADVFNYEPLP